MPGPLPINRLTVPLFSSDYAKVNREIAEWNRRARNASFTLDEQIRILQSQIDALSGGLSGIGLATKTAFGIVKTDATVSNPVVYLKVTLDLIIADLQAQITANLALITALTVRVSTLETNQTPQRGDGAPNPVATPGRYDGDEYWDMLGGPGTYRWLASTSEWLSM